jgi:hypothetical protein
LNPDTDITKPNRTASGIVNEPAAEKPGTLESNAECLNAREEPDGELLDLIRSWQSLLTLWATDSRIGRAARIALRLSDHHPSLDQFVAMLAAGDFRELPQILVLDWEEMEGSACAYAPERRLILINREWLANALAEQVFAVLTEQLGHHLDVLFNPLDTPGDEGELFLECLRAGDPSDDTIALFRKQEPGGVVHLHGESIAVEEAGAGAVCFDLRDLPYPSEQPPA